MLEVESTGHCGRTTTGSGRNGSTLSTCMAIFSTMFARGETDAHNFLGHSPGGCTIDRATVAEVGGNISFRGYQGDIWLCYSRCPLRGLCNGRVSVRLSRRSTSAVCHNPGQCRFHAGAGGRVTGPQIVASPRPQIVDRPPNFAVLFTHCDQLILRKISKFDAT